jgi:replicative DNA helicase
MSENGQREFMHLYTGHGVTIEKLTSMAQNALDRGELELLVVDYIQLLKTVQRTSSDFERLSMVSKGLKELALTLDVPILTAAQVRRQSGGGGVLRAPGLDELRGSGDLEQDADNVLLIHSPDTPDDDSLKRLPDEHAGIFERAMQRGMKPFSIDVAKQRQGALRRTWCMFLPKTMTFYEDG